MADLIISQPMTFTVDVKNGLVERPQRESLMRGDKMANRIIAELVYGSEPFDITGVTVKGKFCRPPNGDEIDLAGEAKGNVAEVQLTDQCYTSGGHYEARVILVLGGVERTVLFISGDVLKSGSGNAASDEDTGGSGGSTGSGLPAGGTAGQVLVKVSSAQGNAIWKTLTAEDVGAAKTNHAAANTTYGMGNNTNYGHVRLLDSYNSTSGENAGIAATPNSVNAVYKIAAAALPSAGTAKNSEKLGGKAPEYYLQPVNLLDNSDFRNPVNQRRQTIYEGNNVYSIDRWKVVRTKLSVSDNGITIANDSLTGTRYIYQKVQGNFAGKTITFAAGGLSGGAYIRIFDFNIKNNFSDNAIADGHGTACVSVTVPSYATDGVAVVIYLVDGTSITPKWAALYEGSYAADNLPPYVPKEAPTEYLACRTYFKRFALGTYNGFITNGATRVYIPINDWAMRIMPTATMNGVEIFCRTVNGYETGSDSANKIYPKAIGVSGNNVNTNVYFEFDAAIGTNNTPVCIQIVAGYFDLSADL